MTLRTMWSPPIRRRARFAASHLALAALAYLAATVVSHDFRMREPFLLRFIQTLPYLLIVRLLLAHRFRLDRDYWRHVGMRDLLQLTAAVVAGSAIFPVALLLFDELYGLPPSVFVLEAMFAVAAVAGVRVAARCVHELRQRRTTNEDSTRTFVLGAGESGEQLVRQLLHDNRHGMELAGLIDDDPAKQGRSLHGVPVLGTSDQLLGLAAVHRVKRVLIAIPSAAPERLRELVDRCTEARVEAKLLPPLQDLVSGDADVMQIRDVEIDDLLGRDAVKLDLVGVESDLAGKVVLVTGAGGTIGGALVREIATFHPLQLVLVDRAESALYFVQHAVARAHPEVDVIAVLASVTNSDRLQQIFDVLRPDCVFHAAAYKHVPMLEANVVEGVWNNVFGTLRTARCAARAGTAKFLLISTDKAVNPTSILGATKLLAERVVLELPSLRASGTDFRVVRFGNVLGSDGSVVPLFQRQLAGGGPLTVTHPEVRRYFMTISEAARLVLQAAALPEAAGRIALLEMGRQVRILDLAEQLIRLAGRLPYRDVQIVFTGLRPGEKLEEELVGPGETAVPTSADKIRVTERNGSDGKNLARGLRQLTAVTGRWDEQQIVRALAGLVTTYRPTPSMATPYRNGGAPARYPSNGRAADHAHRVAHAAAAAANGGPS